ncbi:enolase C-terminal domain-like protein [Tianweitania populi]|uniref:Mandelate racemase n=1 Tax=Tianweitania populi TaxID=1607949 RepID=A0A8J3GMC4_9HYPH|nr:enolase C-terminal domain-like protein [Tianweitania populi]GHD23671.1 mandelate racemase [Tianweitania populi]
MQPNLTIDSIIARPVVTPLARPIRTAVGTVESAPLVLIDVRTKEGVIGSAYIFAYTGAALGGLTRLVRDVGEELAGRVAAPRDLMCFFDRRFRLLGWQGLVAMAVSGIDMAVWDALGKAAGIPVAALLGASPRQVQAYDSYGVIDPRRDLQLVTTSVERGFTAIKIKLGDGDLETDVEAVRLVREAIGSSVRLMVDYNQALDRVEAVRRIRALQSYDLYWVEEPVKAEDHLGHAAVRRAVATPIQTGENWWFPADMAASIGSAASDFAMPDLMKIGGVTGWIDAAAMASSAGMPISSHIFMEASAHVMAASPTAHYIEHLDLASAVLSEPMHPKGGTIQATGNGLGLCWDEDAVLRYSAV